MRFVTDNPTRLACIHYQKYCVNLRFAHLDSAIRRNSLRGIVYRIRDPGGSGGVKKSRRGGGPAELTMRFGVPREASTHG